MSSRANEARPRVAHMAGTPYRVMVAGWALNPHERATGCQLWRRAQQTRLPCVLLPPHLQTTSAAHLKASHDVMLDPKP